MVWRRQKGFRPAAGGGTPIGAGMDPRPMSVMEVRRSPCPVRRDDLPHSVTGRLAVPGAPSPFEATWSGAICVPTMANIELTLPARAENVAVVRHAIGGLGEALDLDPQTLSDVKLAVTEACTNVVVHAYDGAEGPMQVAAEIAPDHLTVTVRDEGRGIVPRPDSPGLGLGLPLIATLTESLELGKDDRERTEVRMSFRLGDAP